MNKEESRIFLSKDTQNKIESAIEQAELNTSGEIRVHIEKQCKGNPLERAVYIFNKLKMDKTALRNGILLYVAYGSKKVAIIGDEGINAVTPENYWDEIISQMLKQFSQGQFAEGMADAVLAVGIALKEHFPYCEGDINEQSNEVSYGN